MATIQTAIQLQDHFTGVFSRVIESVNLGSTAMEELQENLNSPVNTSSMEAARESIYQTAAAMQELNELLQHSSQLNEPSPVVANQSHTPIPPQLETVSWNSDDGIEVFTNTGIERFQQELASVNRMLDQISMVQSQITQRANEMELLSPQASYEIQSVENRIQSLRDQIEQVETNSLTINTEEGNIALEQLRFQMHQLEGEQEQLQLAMQGTDVSAINQAYLQLSQILDGMEHSVQECFSQPLDYSILPVEIPPVEVPIVWKTEELEVFSGTGLERFRQEVQSTNGMLEQLSSAQNVIARQAYQMDLLPPEAFQDLNQMATRIDVIRNQIQQIENHPMNLGTDAANAEFEQLRGQFNQAIQEQQNLNHAMEQMDVSAANEAYLRLAQIIGNVEKHIRDNVDEQGRFNRKVQQGTEEANCLVQTIKSAVAAYATAQTVSKVFDLSDQLTSTTARLNLMNDELQSTQELQNMIFLSAERSRGSYQATADAVSKLGLMAGNAFSSSEEIVAFMEQINKQFRIAGTGAAGIDAAMLQLTQAMGSGVLRGEEYNSILEQAPNIIQAIADYMGIPKEKIKDMAAEGQITAEIVKAAVFAAADETNAKFESMPKTFEQIWTSFQNHALFAFQPILQKLNELANGEQFQLFVNGAIELLGVFANIVLSIFDGMMAIGNFLSQNWSVLSPIIYGVATALAVYYGWQMLCAGAAAVRVAKENILNAILSANPTMKVVLATIALIVVIMTLCNWIATVSGVAETGFGLLCGVVSMAAAFLLNVAIGLFNALLQAVWTIFAEPFLGVVEWILNVANGGFDSFGGAVANLIGQIIGWFLSLGKVVTKIIDAIFGTNWTAGLSSLQNEVIAWGKNETAITFDRKVPIIDSRIDYGDAFHIGSTWGDGVAEKFSQFQLSDLFGTTDFPNSEDYTDLLSGMNSNISAIAGNTGSIADSVDISEEDLKYMRDLAERETINRVTMTDIKIDMGGVTNHVNNEMDLDGMINHLTEALETQIAISAEGIH